jgi:hypothetical protein
VIAQSLDYICAERLTPNLAAMADHLAAHNELELTPALLGQLERISVSTVRRRLKAFHAERATSDPARMVDQALRPLSGGERCDTAEDRGRKDFFTGTMCKKYADAEGTSPEGSVFKNDNVAECE